MSTLPYFGRAWKVTVTTPSGTYTLSSSDFKQALRVTFEVEMVMMMAYWQAQVTTFNVSNETQEQIASGAPSLAQLWQSRQPLVSGDTVTISAGYQSDASGNFEPGANVIYQGKVLQPIWVRENVVDFKMTLRCITGFIDDAWNFVEKTVSKKFNDKDTLDTICASAETPIPVNYIGDDTQAILSRKVHPGSQTFHGRPWHYIDLICSQNNLFRWVNEKGLNVRSFDSFPSTPDYTYGPPIIPGTYTPNANAQGTIKNTLIGSPQQTQEGVMIRVLLDPKVKIADTFNLAPGVLVTPVPIQYGPSGVKPPMISFSGLYAVAAVRHYGDTRGVGEDWYTEITGFAQDFYSHFLPARHVN